MSGICILWGVVANLPSPYPLPQAGEGKDFAHGVPSAKRRDAVTPPLPLAGEGWGEGKPESTPQGCCFQAPPPYAEALRRSKIESREIPNERERAYVRGPRPVDPRAARHRARRSAAPGRTRNPRRIGRSASVGGTDSRSACDAAGNTKDVVRRRSSSRVARVHSQAVRTYARFPSPYPLPQAGEGKTARQKLAAIEVGNRRT